MKKNSSRPFKQRFLVLLAVAVLINGWASETSAQEEKLGQSRQAIVSGSPVKTDTQEDLGLLTLTTASGTCSAALLTNDLVITAAHCFDLADISNPSQVTLTANWATVQSRQGREIQSFGQQPDIALVRVTSAFRVKGKTSGYRREIASEEDYYALRTYGRGVNVLASGSGAAATPTQSDGQFRYAVTQISKLEQYRFWFPRNKNGEIVAGGDSGGPSFGNVWGRTVLLGVHSSCRTRCLAGQTCAAGSWTWIGEIIECGDATVYSSYDQIVQAMNESTAALEVGRPVGDRGPVYSEATSANTGLKDGRFETWTTPAGAVSFIYAVGADGNLQWRRHDGAELGLPQWQNALPVGSGWQNYLYVFSGGRDIIYAITPEGDLLWFHHRTAYNAPALGRRRPSLEGPIVVGKGWQNFRHVFSAGDGIIYAIDQSGNLLWYRHKAFMQPVAMPSDATLGPGRTLDRAQGPWVSSWEDVNPRIVGKGWGDFKQVFSGAKGIIYTVTQDGTLQRYRHIAYLDGRGIESAGAWEGPRVIKSGWGEYQRIFSSGDGVIYAVAPSGELFWFKDRAPLSASAAPRSLGKPWMGPRKVDDGWGGFLKVFALMPSAPDVIR